MTNHIVFKLILKIDVNIFAAMLKLMERIGGLNTEVIKAGADGFTAERLVTDVNVKMNFTNVCPVSQSLQRNRLFF